MSGGAERRDLRQLALVGGVLVLVQALVLAALALPIPHSGGDNMAYLALAHALLEGAGYTELWDPATPPHTKYPPVFPAILALQALLGATTWAAFKAGSAVALSLSTLLVFAWSVRRHGVGGAGALALLLVLAAGWQDASRWILSEPWFLLFTFAALWAGDAALGRGARPAAASAGRDDAPGDPAPGDPPARDRVALLLLLAGAATLLAFGVRTAGLPLVIAFGGALLLTRHFRAAAIHGLATLLVVGGWMLRARQGGEGAYGDEFWLRSPYAPELGRIGPLDLLGRIRDNAEIYLLRVFPGEWWSGLPGWVPEGAVALLGALLALLALAGWGARLRAGGWGLAELFAPLYGGLILIWPEVWSGERFFLPLLPLALAWAGEGAVLLARTGPLRGLMPPRAEPRPPARGGRKGSRAEAPRRDPAAILLVGAGVLLLALPALPRTMAEASWARECRIRVEAHRSPLACYGPGIAEFAEAARWAGRNLPPDAAVLSRKPRIHFALGGPQSRTFPFTTDPDVLLEGADRAGARWLLLDHWDGVAGHYLIPVLQARPLAFCHIRGWGGGDGRPGTDLFGILPPSERQMGGSVAEMERCPAGWSAASPVDPPHLDARVPLFAPGG